MAEASYFLDGWTRGGAVVAGFVGRVPGVAVSTDKRETLERLESVHREVVEELGFGWEALRRAEQVHGGEVAVVTGSEEPVAAGVDGLVTDTRGLLLGIHVADCAAVYLMDERRGAIGLVHSGKKGTELGIVTAAIAKMEEVFGTRAEDLKAAISPCIRPPHYEVDIAEAIRTQLGQAGVAAGNVRDSGVCTAAQVSEYYSYRRERGCTGRMLALLGLREEKA